MNARRTYQVKEVSRLAGVSIRTLHYYEEIGLLVPAGRTDAGYRMYSDDDLLRLQQILIARELGLALEEIRRSLDDPMFNRREALLAHKKQLQQRASKTAAMIAAVDAAFRVLESGGEEMEELFEGSIRRNTTRRRRCVTAAAQDDQRHIAEQVGRRLAGGAQTRQHGIVTAAGFCNVCRFSKRRDPFLTTFSKPFPPLE